MRKRALVAAASLVLLLGLAAPACTFVEGAFGGLGSWLGSNSNDSCDRRYGEKPEPFCQELDDTVAGSEFQDDCRKKFKARALGEYCPRARRVGGCVDEKKNDDKSVVTDWYYDVSDMIADGGVEGGGDGGDGTDSAASDAGDAAAAATFDPAETHLTADDVKLKCQDHARYSDGAYFVPAP
jgi:hypothetical protein